MVETIVLVTGGFDPIHSGHIAYFLVCAGPVSFDKYGKQMQMNCLISL